VPISRMNQRPGNSQSALNKRVKKRLGCIIQNSCVILTKGTLRSQGDWIKGKNRKTGGEEINGIELPRSEGMRYKR